MMTRTPWLALLAAVTLVACAQPTPEQQIVNDAAEALGGSERIQAVQTLSIGGEGVLGNLGQDMTPEAATQTFTISDYSRYVDVAAGRARIEQTRTPNYTYFQGQAPQKQVMGVDGDVGYNVAANGNVSRVPNPVAMDRQAELYHHPVTIVRAALDPAAIVANARTEGGESLVDVTTPDGRQLTLAIDDTTKLPTRVSSMTDHPNLGDVTIETRFADYQDVGGLQLPAQLATTTDGFRTAEIRVTTQAVDAEVGDLSAPAEAASAAPIAGPPPANVTVEEVADGIWLLAGQSHHSVLVELSDHLMLIEAPNEARTLAVIARARELVPDKPLTHLLNSHHHFDHSGGIRAAVSEGLAIITHEANAAFYRQLVERPRTIAPDALTRNPQPLTLETVADEMVIEDEARTVHLFHIEGNPHADTLLMAYFPRERILVEADAYSPASSIHPFATNLAENVTKRSLRVDRIVPIHGSVVPYAELLKATGTPTT